MRTVTWFLMMALSGINCAAIGDLMDSLFVHILSVVFSCTVLAGLQCRAQLVHPSVCYQRLENVESGAIHFDQRSASQKLQIDEQTQRPGKRPPLHADASKHARTNSLIVERSAGDFGTNHGGYSRSNPRVQLTPLLTFRVESFKVVFPQQQPPLAG